MSNIDTKISNAIVQVLQECNGRALGVRALATYINPSLAVPASAEDVQRHVADLEGKGYVERVAHPLNANELTYRITESGKLL